MLHRLAWCAFAGGLLPSKAADIIGGQGQFRYQYDPTKLVMPEGTQVQDAHGFAIDAEGNIFHTYVPNATDKGCLVRFAPDGTGGVVVPMDPKLCKGTPHGLRLSVEGSDTFLYHANNGQALHKTTLEGTEVWSSLGPPNNDSKFLPYAPTWFATPPGAFAYMADGYGSNFIHVYTKDGKYTGRSFGGTGTELGKFKTCHSINFDPRVGKLIVTDRENHRHQYFDYDAEAGDLFRFSSNFTVEGLQRPCNIRFDFGAGFAVVPALEGPVGIVDKDNRLVSTIDVAGLLGAQGHLHPHDATLLPNGDLIVCTWAPGRLSYWRRLPSIEDTVVV